MLHFTTDELSMTNKFIKHINCSTFCFKQAEKLKRKDESRMMKDESRQTDRWTDIVMDICECRVAFPTETSQKA